MIRIPVTNVFYPFTRIFVGQVRADGVHAGFPVLIEYLLGNSSGHASGLFSQIYRQAAGERWQDE